MESIIYPFLVSLVLFYVYETDFFVQYVKLFRLGKLFKVNEYEKHQAAYPSNSYWEWLVWDKKTFLRELLACPFCSGFWMNVSTAFLHKDLALFVVNLWISLFLFLFLKVMVRRAYDNA